MRDIRPTWAEVDLDAVRHNVTQLRRMAAPAEVCAVVKAFGYGHGPVRIAEAALSAGATSLGVALVEEGRQLRAAGIDEPILVLSQPALGAMNEVVHHQLTVALYTAAGIEALADAAGAAGETGFAVHLKIDTGMHRVGAQPDEVLDLVRQIEKRSELALRGIFTHLAVADEPKNPFTLQQLTTFDAALCDLRAVGFDPGVVHAANSAGAIEWPAARYDLVRCGIAIYGSLPALSLTNAPDLRPALSLHSRVSHVKQVAAGERFSYGLHTRIDRPTNVATVPIGYADGVPRRLGLLDGSVLINGSLRPILGVVTMDQLMVDCGHDDVESGDEVVLLGSQGDETITAWDWAGKLDLISYEILCGISARVPRRYKP